MEREPIRAIDEPAAGNYFVSAYPPFSCWDPAALADFRRTLARASPNRETPLGLYVHIPFCVHRCQYCYYLAYDGRLEQMEDYLEAVTREFSQYKRSAALADRELSFVYFGGGTPSLLSVGQLSRFLGGLQQISGWSEVREATFECAPRSVTEEKLQLLRDAGITRLSLGVQQLDDDVLARNGRAHRVEHVLRAYERVRGVGFDVVNLDLIAGLVGETDESFSRSLEQVVDLAPDSVTIYQLEIPHNTPLYRGLRDGTVDEEPAPWKIKRGRLARGFACLEAAGYTVRSAYAAVRDPRRCEFVYQEEQYRGADLLGIGVSSFSYLAGVHAQNLARLESYIDAVSRNELPLMRGYSLSAEERLVREFVLQLKLGRVNAARLRERYGVDVTERFSEPLETLREAGWLEFNGEDVRLTREGLLRVDGLLPEFY